MWALSNSRPPGTPWGQGRDGGRQVGSPQPRAALGLHSRPLIRFHPNSGLCGSKCFPVQRPPGCPPWGCLQAWTLGRGCVWRPWLSWGLWGKDSGASAWFHVSAWSSCPLQCAPGCQAPAHLPVALSRRVCLPQLQPSLPQ